MPTFREVLIAAAAITCAGPSSRGASGELLEGAANRSTPALSPTFVSTFAPSAGAVPETRESNPTPEAPPSGHALSIGRPNLGALVNAVSMTDGPEWVVVNPERAYGTEETIASLVAAIHAVNEAYPGSPKVYVGDISAEHGGHIRPHHSHQSGRDVDLGLYYKKGPAWFVRARADNLDVPRSWELVKALVRDPNVEVMFVDRSIQRLLKAYAVKTGESPERVDALFDERSAFSDRLIRHEWGHLTHIHVRFKCPMAREAGERAHRELAMLHRIPPLKYY